RGPVPLFLICRQHLGLDQADRAADLFHRLMGGCRGVVHGDVDFRLELARAEQPDPVLLTTDHAGRNECGEVDRLAGVDLASVDGLRQPAQAQLVPLLALPLVEAALRQAPVERHLTAFETAEADARARLLALYTPAGSLAETGADAPADTNAELAGSGIVLQFIETHGSGSQPVRRSRRRCGRDAGPC